MHFHKCIVSLTIVLSFFLVTVKTHNYIVITTTNVCYTPLNALGKCVSLKECPEVVNLFTKLPINLAKQYSQVLQRLCDNQITLDNYPVVCCTDVVRNGDENYNGEGFRRRTELLETTRRPSTTTTTTTIRSTTPNVQTRQSQPTCETPDFQRGFCQALETCPVLFNRILENPADEEFKQHLRNSHITCGERQTIVCCPSTISRIRNNPNAQNNAVYRLPNEEQGCGLVTVTTDKIIGGDDSAIGAWPWMALIGYDPFSSQPFRCGGTLVSARHVITAAHCIRNDLSFVRLGEYDLTNETETKHVDINVIKHATHPQFGRNRRSDMAVLLLETLVQFTTLIAPICMPLSENLRSKSFVNYMPYVAGWGYTRQSGVISPILKQTQLPILENSVCRRIYTNLLPTISPDEYDDSIICAGYEVGGKDTCRGDSGGPLMIPQLYKGVTRYYLIGVVSYGHGCGKVPGIYISTQHWMDWILEQISTLY